MDFKKHYMHRQENQIKYGLKKEVNFTAVILKKCLKDNDIEMYSTHNERKSAVAERFIRTLKNKIYKHITLVSKNEYIDKLDQQ